MTPQESKYTYDEEARRALGQVYTMLLQLAREAKEKEDASSEDREPPMCPKPVPAE
jgi:hypothetical protein